MLILVDRIDLDTQITGTFNAADVASVPDAGPTALLLGAGLLGLVAVRRRIGRS